MHFVSPNQSLPQLFENFLNVIQAVGEQLSNFEVINSDKVFKVSLMPILLVADTPAKHSVLNWISHIGYYGCCYCFNKGKRFVGRHHYPLHPYSMRTLVSYKLDLSTLARNPGLKSKVSKVRVPCQIFFQTYRCLHQSTTCIRSR